VSTGHEVPEGHEAVRFAPGFAKLEFTPEKEFMGLFVRTCTRMQLEGFDPQELALTINGESVVWLWSTCPNGG
jgi:hypothetical protein